jgi:acyl-coenzyme A synthetase/AMP-(fatty) acid ligase
MSKNDYQSIVDNFDFQRPERFNFAGDIIDRWAQDPEKRAILWVDDNGSEIDYSFAQLSEASRRLCNVMTTNGVKRGDTCVIVLGRQLAWWEAVTACLRMGVVVSPGTTQLSAKDLSYRINMAGATCFISDAGGADKLDSVADECGTLVARLQVDGGREGWLDYQAELVNASPDFETADTASDEESLCYFTSGTTGHPKMAIHTHSYGLGHEATGKYWLDLEADDLHWNISDTGWAKAAWSSYFGPWMQGAALFVHHTGGFSPQRTLELLSQYPVTTMCGAPTIYRMLVLEDLASYNFETLRHCVGAGEPLNPEVIETWRKHTGLTIRDGYGQTETVMLCANLPCFEPRFGSMGKPAPGIDLRVIDEDGNVLPPNTEGDIAVRMLPKPPQGFFKGYKGKPELTAKTFRGEEWYLTGDRATVDEDGYFWFVSRADDVILSAGYRIGPFEVESALIEHAAVAESAVVSSPDEKRGEVVKAFVVLAPGYEAGDELVSTLQNHVKAVTAPYKYPRKIEFVTELPKTVSGKIRRVELRQREWG